MYFIHYITRKVKLVYQHSLICYIAYDLNHESFYDGYDVFNKFFKVLEVAWIYQKDMLIRVMLF